MGCVIRMYYLLFSFVGEGKVGSFITICSRVADAYSFLFNFSLFEFVEYAHVLLLLLFLKLLL